jgi:hypothetical protein
MKLLELILEQDNDEVLRRVVKGFKLVHTQEGFGNFAFTTKNGYPHPSLAGRINMWLEKSFPFSGVRCKYETTYRTINFFVKQDNLTETE